MEAVHLGRNERGELVTIHVHLPGDLPIAEAHTRTAEIEKVVRAAVPRAYRVTVHPEPDEE